MSLINAPDGLQSRFGLCNLCEKRLERNESIFFKALNVSSPRLIHLDLIEESFAIL